MSIGEQTKILEKLHKQFGHATADRLKTLLKSAGVVSDNIFTLLEKVVSKCDLCARFKRTPSRPVVGLPMATCYNETVALDLFEVETNVWVFHMIDMFSRFSAACVIKTKRASEIVNMFIRHWISIHGPPKKCFSDNGLEFNNQEFRDMSENFNIEVKTSAAFSPWSCGVVERHNGILKEILVKVKLDYNYDLDVALAWSLNAKNSLHNVNGYSSYQIVFGQNPNLPSVLSDKLPALEGTTVSESVGKHISALHETRKTFLEFETSDRLRRALRRKVSSKVEQFLSGDKVYYKRHDSREWKGPGTVIGQDGAVVFVRHGGTYVRVHQCRLSKVCNDKDSGDTDNERGKAPCATIVQLGEQGETTVSDRQVQDVHCEDNSGGLSDQGDESDEGDSTHTRTQNVSVPVEAAEGTAVSVCDTSDVLVKKDQTVRYVDMDNRVVIGKVVSRAGKVTGRNKTWFNIEYLQHPSKEGLRESVDMSRVSQVEILQSGSENTDNAHTSVQEDNTASEIASQESVMILEEETFTEAKFKELDNWRQNQVFEEVQDVGQKCVSTRWILTMKDSTAGVIPKARLVARGFEELCKDEIQRDSPTCTMESLKLILAVLAQKGWKPFSMDIKTAFLQGHLIERDVFIRPPKEVKVSGKVWRLKKCVYGLVDASLYWYNRVKTVMTDLGAKMSKVDPAVFYWMDPSGDEVIGVLATHVDDFLWGGTPYFEQNIIGRVRDIFCVGKESSEAFRYIGVDLYCRSENIVLHQENYISSVTPAELNKDRLLFKEACLTEDEKTLLRSKVGQLLWVARHSRPDILFEVSCLAGRVKDATVGDIMEANKIIRKLKADKVRLNFLYVGDSDLQLVVFSDASFANLKDGGSQGGHFIALMGQSGRFSPICWKSKRIRRVVRSTLAAETLSLADGIDSCVFLATLYAEITRGVPSPDVLPIVCFVDNRSLVEAIKSTKFVEDKRLRLEISAVKELISTRQVRQVYWTQSAYQLADCLTKKGASSFSLLKAISDGVWKAAS